MACMLFDLLISPDDYEAFSPNGLFSCFVSYTMCGDKVNLQFYFDLNEDYIYVSRYTLFSTLPETQT